MESTVAHQIYLVLLVLFFLFHHGKPEFPCIEEIPATAMGQFCMYKNLFLCYGFFLIESLLITPQTVTINNSSRH